MADVSELAFEDCLALLLERELTDESGAIGRGLSPTRTLAARAPKLERAVRRGRPRHSRATFHRLGSADAPKEEGWGPGPAPILQSHPAPPRLHAGASPARAQ